MANLLENIRRKSFRMQLTLAVLLLLIPLISLISYFNYSTVSTNLGSSHELAQDQVERDMEATFKLVDIGLNVIGKSYEPEMIDAFQFFGQEYENSGRNVSAMNLEGLHGMLNETFDLYVIDSNGVIISTTYSPDLNLDFSEIAPDFYNSLTQIRTEGNFTLDRVSPETQTGAVRIYAYMPSPDRQYIFELGLVTEEFSQFSEELSYLHAAAEIVNANPLLKSMRIFTAFGDLLGDPNFVLDTELQSIISTVLDTQIDYSYNSDDSLELTKYRFVRLDYGEYPTASVDFIVEFVYDRTSLMNSLSIFTFQYIILGSLAIVLTTLITYFGTGRITNPIHEIVEDASVISQGNLDHEIKEYKSTELRTLSTSLNKMVRSLRESKDRAVLYLDLLGHDIMNKFQVIVTCMDLISRAPSQADYETLIIRTDSAIADCRELITKMSLTESVTSNPIAVRQLDIAIANTINHIKSKYDDLEIIVQGYCPRAEVVGDALLEQLFIMIIENARKHNKSEEKKVWIQVFEIDEGYQTTISDNGIGIPDKRKKSLFDISRRYGGVDLHLCKHMVEKYGGTIRVENRIEGDRTKGSEFIIWLPKAYR